MDVCNGIQMLGIWGIQICLEARDWPQGRVVFGLAGTSCDSMKERAWDELDAGCRPLGLAPRKAFDTGYAVFVRG